MDRDNFIFATENNIVSIVSYKHVLDNKIYNLKERVTERKLILVKLAKKY
jgi:hypothetical protein